MRTTTIRRLIGAALLASATLCAQAMDLRPDAISFEAGPGQRAPRMASIGLTWDWDYRGMSRMSELTARTELLLNHWWIDPVENGHRYVLQYVVLPTLRMRLDRGASPWFIDAGIGLSWLDHEYRTPLERFGSRWNFYDVIGFGYTIGGPQGRNEIGLRWTHTSNAGFAEPNPGQNFLLLRYVRRF